MYGTAEIFKMFCVFGFVFVIHLCILNAQSFIVPPIFKGKHSVSYREDYSYTIFIPVLTG